MNLDEAIESFFSYAKINGEDIPIFFVGTQDDIDGAIKELKDDLASDLGNGIPWPFPRVAIFQKVEPKDTPTAASRNIVIPWSVELASRGPGPFDIGTQGNMYVQGRGWHTDHEVSGTIEREGDTGRFKTFLNSHRWHIRKDATDNHFADMLLGAALDLAIISHPGNYIVRESPQLTPHEARRIESGKRFPDAKRPRYIIVDHDVLVGMQGPAGTHASPIPHKRRGHWMRLAERCRHAKERGVDKVFVRDCYVGNCDFISNGRRYQVLLDFQKNIARKTP